MFSVIFVTSAPYEGAATVISGEKYPNYMSVGTSILHVFLAATTDGNSAHRANASYVVHDNSHTNAHFLYVRSSSTAETMSYTTSMASSATTSFYYDVYATATVTG